MTMKIIESTSNPIIKKALSLHMRKNRKKHQQFLLEGMRGIQDMLSEASQIDIILYEKRIASLPGGESLILKWKEAGIKSAQVSENIMKKIAETQTPQGVLAIVDLPGYDFNEIIRDSHYVLLLDEIQDPGNMGTLIRSAEAAGFDAVIMTPGCTDPFSTKCIRAATGAVLHIPVFELKSTEEAWEKLRQNQYRILGAALEDGKAYTMETYEPPLVLIIGNEARGINSTLQAQMDGAITIPMKGKTQSLNAAIAGSVLMFHVAAACREDETMV